MSGIFEKINMTPKQVINIILLLLLLIFIVQNVEAVRVKFLFTGFDLPLIIIIVISFFIGFLTSKAFFSKKTKVKEEEPGKEDRT